jgi:hypothetical protein
MIVDLILKSCIAGGIGARLTLQHDRAAVRHDQAGPDQQHTRLPERNLAIIDADQPRPLGHEKETARRAIEDVLGNLDRDRLRSSQAERPVRHHAGNGTGRPVAIGRDIVRYCGYRTLKLT